MRNAFLGVSLFAAVLVGCVTGSMVPLARAQAEGGPIRYEYYVASVKDAVSSKRFAQKNKEILDQAGAQGWELVAVEVNTFYFRRPLDH